MNYLFSVALIIYKKKEEKSSIRATYLLRIIKCLGNQGLQKNAK